MKILIPIFILLFAVSAFAQSDLPDKGSISEIRGKTKYYLNAEADNAKQIRREMKRSKLVEVQKASDADFIIEYEILSQKEKPDLLGLPGSNTVRRGQMQVYYYREGKKVVVFSDVKEGGEWSLAPALALSRRFLKQLKDS